MFRRSTSPIATRRSPRLVLAAAAHAVAMAAIAATATGCSLLSAVSHVTREGPEWSVPAAEEPLAVESRPGGADDLAPLSDEFDDPKSLAKWTNLRDAEGWLDDIKTVDVNAKHAGNLTIEPHASFWFGDFHAPFLFKKVTGDFLVTTRVFVTGAKADVPERGYSLAGLLARAPRPEGRKGFEEGKENWIFITAGTGDGDGEAQFETKNTVDSESRLELSPRPTGWVELRIARVGQRITLLRRQVGSSWRVLRREERPDLPATLQVGMIAYTDFDTLKWDLVFNDVDGYHARAIDGGVPDLVGRFDYVRFQRPVVAKP